MAELRLALDGSADLLTRFVEATEFVEANGEVAPRAALAGDVAEFDVLVCCLPVKDRGFFGRSTPSH